ncbi:hypothetical protein [Streptomyces mirabilis]|uniref:hypothetical protein n=2 Tax=Streptomyces mirabilis TaxID=68239 RepID=UPI00367567FA
MSEDKGGHTARRARDAIPARTVSTVSRVRWCHREAPSRYISSRIPALPSATARCRSGVIVAGSLNTVFLGLEVVRGGIQAFWEQSKLAGPRQRRLAWPAAADVQVLVPSDVHGECALHLQSAPDATVTQHAPHQLQRDIERHLRSVMEAGKAGRKESLKPEVFQRPLEAEVREGRHLGFAYGQALDAGLHGERQDRLQIGRLDLAVIADGVLGARVVPVFITVGRVVLGDAVHVGELHVPILQHSPDTALRK